MPRNSTMIFYGPEGRQWALVAPGGSPERVPKNSKFIDSNKHTAKKLHHMDLQETSVLRIQRERESHLDTNYGPEGL